MDVFKNLLTSLKLKQLKLPQYVLLLFHACLTFSLQPVRRSKRLRNEEPEPVSVEPLLKRTKAVVERVKTSGKVRATPRRGAKTCNRVVRRNFVPGKTSVL